MKEFYSLNEIIYAINPSFVEKKWCTEYILDYSDTDRSKYCFIEIQRKTVNSMDIIGCFHPRYANQTWLEALLNMKKFKLKTPLSPLERLREKPLVFHEFDYKLYAFDHHRTLFAKFLELEDIDAEVTVYRSRNYMPKEEK